MRKTKVITVFYHTSIFEKQVDEAIAEGWKLEQFSTSQDGRDTTYHALMTMEVPVIAETPPVLKEEIVPVYSFPDFNKIFAGTAEPISDTDKADPKFCQGLCDALVVEFGKMYSTNSSTVDLNENGDFNAKTNNMFAYMEENIPHIVIVANSIKLMTEDYGWRANVKKLPALKYLCLKIEDAMSYHR